MRMMYQGRERPWFFARLPGPVLSDNKRVIHVPADVNQSHISAVCCCLMRTVLALALALEPRSSSVVLERTLRSLILLMLVL